MSEIKGLGSNKGWTAFCPSCSITWGHWSKKNAQTLQDALKRHDEDHANNRIPENLPEIIEGLLPSFYF